LHCLLQLEILGEKKENTSDNGENVKKRDSQNEIAAAAIRNFAKQ